MILTESRKDRTWRSQPDQNVYLRRPPGNESFDGQLPAQARIELEEFPAPPQVFLRPHPQTSRRCEVPPVLPPEVFLRPPPPVSPPRPPVIPAPSQSMREAAPPRGAGIWWLLAALLGFPVLIGLLPHERSSQGTQTDSRWVEVRRALPIASDSVEVRRALPAQTPQRSSLSSPFADTQWQAMRMPDDTIVSVSYQGDLPSSAALPAQGRFIGEEYSTGDTRWIWMTRAGAAFPSWVDP
jgi:hypothetical protein